MALYLVGRLQRTLSATVEGFQNAQRYSIDRHKGTANKKRYDREGAEESVKTRLIPSVLRLGVIIRYI